MCVCVCVSYDRFLKSLPANNNSNFFFQVAKLLLEQPSQNIILEILSNTEIMSMLYKCSII